MKPIYLVAALSLALPMLNSTGSHAFGRRRPSPPAPAPSPAPTSPAPRCEGLPDDAFLACYHVQTGFGELRSVTTVPAIDFNWGEGSPDASVPADQFSARYQGSFAFNEEGTYRLTTTSDDGVRLYVDDALVIDAWQVQAASARTADVRLAAGRHKIVLEYFEEGGQASAKLAWERLPDAPPPPVGPCYPALRATDEEGAILEAAKHVRNHFPQYFVDTATRADANDMMREVINVLRHNRHDAGRAIAHASRPVGDPYRWGSDALGYRGASGEEWRIYDVYTSWPSPATPQTLLHGAGAAEISPDLLALGAGRRCP